MRSRFETRIGQYLKSRGIDYKYEQYSYEYEQPLRRNRATCANCGSKDLVQTAWYTPDFFLPNGIIIETKGRFTAADRRKMLAIRETNEELKDVKLLFMRDNKIHKNSSTYYSDWCMENNYDFAIGEPKDEWLKD